MSPTAILVKARSLSPEEIFKACWPWLKDQLWHPDQVARTLSTLPSVSNDCDLFVHEGIKQSEHGHSKGPREGAAKRAKKRNKKKEKRDHMHQAATGTSEDDLWLPSKVHRQAAEPATVSDYEQ